MITPQAREILHLIICVALRRPVQIKGYRGGNASKPLRMAPLSSPSAPLSSTKSSAGCSAKPAGSRSSIRRSCAAKSPPPGTGSRKSTAIDLTPRPAFNAVRDGFAMDLYTKHTEHTDISHSAVESHAKIPVNSCCSMTRSGRRRGSHSGANPVALAGYNCLPRSRPDGNSGIAEKRKAAFSANHRPDEVDSAGAFFRCQSRFFRLAMRFPVEATAR